MTTHATPEPGTEQTADLMDFMDGDDLDDSGDPDAGPSDDATAGPDDESGTQPGDDAGTQDDGEDGAAVGEAGEGPAATQGAADGTPSAGAQPGATAKPSWDPPAPFTYQVGHQQYDLGETKLGADGVLFVPPEKVEEVRRLLTQGRYHQDHYPRERQQWQRQLDQAKKAFDENAVKNAATAKYWEGLYNKGPEALLTFLEQWAVNRPKLEANAQRAVAEEMYRRAQQMQAGDPADAEERDRGLEQQQLDHFMGQLKASPAHAFLTDGDRDRFRKRLERNRSQLFKRADRDMPEHGLKKGAVYYDQGWFNEELADFAESIQGARAATATTQQARQFNAQRNAAAAPPAGRARNPRPRPAPGTPPKDAKTGRFKSREEWQQHMYRLANVVDATTS